jgi:transglutaminase-like putative cysteine protease
MHFRVTHETVYRYDVPVRLGAHRLRLSPRAEGVRLHEERLAIEPEPVERSEAADIWGNGVTRLGFVGETTQLRVTSTFDLDTDMPTPLAALADPLPWAAAADGLGAFRVVTAGPAVRAYAEQVASETGHNAIAFLDRLAEDICSRTILGIRADGHARSAEETLELREGACRDVTVLFLECARALGVAGRFVSGYQARPAVEDGKRHLHAWAEVFLPGTGWRGFDVTHGIRVTDGHVALCAAPSQAATMPIEGGFSFTGSSVKSTLAYHVAIEAG